MLTLHKVTVRYGKIPAVDNISLHLTAGQWLMLAGPNGAGKSTLLSAISQGAAYTGDILWEGKALRALSPTQRARNLAVLSQQHPLTFDYTVEEIVALGRYAHRKGMLKGNEPQDERCIEQALALTGMEALRKKRLMTLSGGEVQRAFLAQVFAQEPRVLLLDEPANHLDLPYQKHIFSLIQQWLETPGRAALSVVHDLSLARHFGTHALLMGKGQCVAQGRADQVFTPENLERVYHMDVHGWMREMLEEWNGE